MSYLTEVVVLLIIVAWCNVTRLTNEQQVCGKLAPVVSFFVLIQPPPVKVDKVMFDAGSNGICQSVLIVNVFILAVYVSFEFIHKLGECPFTFLHWFPKGWKVAHLGKKKKKWNYHCNYILERIWSKQNLVKVESSLTNHIRCIIINCILMDE